MDILVRLESSPATLDHLMETFHAETALSRRDMRFVNALVFGVQRWRYRLDATLAALSVKPRRKHNQNVLNILRMGLYQIWDMDRVPGAAVVHTAVNLAREMNCDWATGYINAVLRRALREPDTMARPADSEDPVRRLAVAQSFPDWMISRWCLRFGWVETESLCRATNRIPPLTLRTNRLKTSRAQLAAELQSMALPIRTSPYTPAGLMVDRPMDRLFDSRPFHDGWFQIQDEAAQVVGHLVGARPNETILDACAGLGGKTAHLAECMRNRGRVVAVDRDHRKLQRLQTEMQRLGIGIVQTRAITWRDEPTVDLRRDFDRILVDAPCSGMGVLRRNPDAKWKRKPKAFKRYRAAQRKMMAHLVHFLKPGGILVYAVCSTEPEETGEVIEWFLKNHPQFAIEGRPSSLPKTMTPCFNSDGCLQTEVHRHGTDGFFAVRLRKRQ